MLIFFMKKETNIKEEWDNWLNKNSSLNRYNFPIENILNKKISKIVVKKNTR